MAYLSHSPYRFRHEHVGHAASASLLARSALVAVVAGAVIVCLSGAVKQSAGPDQAVAVKSDRLVAPTAHVASAAVERPGTPGADIQRDADGRVVYVSDPAARTTTVSRDATIGLSPQSPLGGGH